MSSHREDASPPRVTVGVPVFNGEKYLAQALTSLLSQTFVDFEVIISDNCSSDETERICREYADRDPRITYIRQTSNIGSYRNFQLATRLATGEFVTWLAHDDLLDPRFLELAVARLLNDPKVVLVSGDFQVIDESGREIEVERLNSIRDDKPWAVRRAEFFRYPISNAFYCIYGLMRTVECQRAIGVLSEPRVATGSELPILARLAVMGEIVSIPYVLRQYRRHAASAFLMELAGLRRMPLLRRKLASLRNHYRLRLDQIVVLLTSTLPFREKVRTFLSVASFYFQLCFIRLARLPSRLKAFLAN